MFVIIGGLILAVLTAALVAPLFINWTDYRSEFEAQATAILGRKVTVAGDASARLLPFPSLAFSDVRVGDDPDNPMLTAERFSMDAELAPFLSGEVLIFDMRLTRPSGLVTINEDGVIDWTMRPKSPVDPSQVRIESLIIEDGHITLDDIRAGRRHEVTGIGATISAKAITGPWRVQGELEFDTEPLAVSISSGSISQTGEIPLAATLTPRNRAFVIEGDGTAKSTEGRLNWNGGFTVRPARLDDKTGANVQSRDGAGGKERPEWTAKGKFDLNAERLDLPEIRLETGAKDNPYIANGKGMVLFGAVPMFDLAFDGAQVTLADEDEADGGGQGRFAALRDTLNAIPYPDMPGTVVFNVPALVAGDTTIRDIGFSANPDKGSWRVQAFRATLPGRTKVEADGRLTSGANVSFEGRLTVASNQPAGFSNWMTGGVDPAIRNLKALGFSADVVLKAESQTVSNLELAIDNSVFKGALERRTDGIRPSIAATLKGGELPLSALSALASGFVSPEGGGRFGTHDVQLALDAGPVTHGLAQAETLGLTIRLKQDRLDIDRLMIGNIAGSTISATGVAENLRAAVKMKVDASLVSADAAPFFLLAAGLLPENQPVRSLLAQMAEVPGLLRDYRANLVATSAAEGGIRSLSASYTARTGGGEHSLAGVMSGEGVDLASGEISADFNIRETEPEKLLQLAGIPVLPLGLEGPAEAKIKAQGRLQDGLSISADYVAGETTAQWTGTVSSGETGMTSAGKLAMKAADFDPYLQATGLVFAGTGTGSALSLTADMEAARYTVTLGGLVLSLADARLTGSVTLDLAQERPKLTGELAAESIDAGLLAESLFGPALTAGMNAPFPGSALIPLDANVSISAAQFVMEPLGIANDMAATLTADAQSVRLSEFKASKANGALTGALEGRNDNGTVSVSANFSLTGAQTAGLTGSAVPGGSADVSGSFSGSGKSLDGLLAGLAGSGVVKLQGAAIPGFNPQGFAPVAVIAGTIENAPSVRDVETLIGQSLRTASMPLTDDVMAWTMAGGTLKMPSIRASAGSAKLDAILNADPVDWTAAISGQVIYDAGKDAVAGAEPQLPFTIQISRDGVEAVTDPQPLVQYLTQAALEREQARVEAMQASLIEKQRLRRAVRRLNEAEAWRQAQRDAREAAVRAAKARDAALMAEAWKLEKARLEAVERKAADQKAAEEAAKKASAANSSQGSDPSGNEPAGGGLAVPDLQPSPTGDADTLKWLKLKLN